MTAGLLKVYRAREVEGGKVDLLQSDIRLERPRLFEHLANGGVMLIDDAGPALPAREEQLRAVLSLLNVDESGRYIRV